jgi:hypothetical protein
MFSLFNRRSTGKLSKRRMIGCRKCIFEPLETRSMLSANGLSDIMASPLAQAVVNVSVPYTPAEIRQAYGFSNISANGAGQTIAIVDAYDDPNVWSDLQTFDRTYGLPDPVFQKVNQNGSQTQLPSANSGWGLEIALDVEWAHAVAPAAKILLVEANSNYLTDLLAAVDYASSVSKVVSMSWGAGEFSSETSFDSHFSAQLHPGVTFIASSGDSGGRTIWPSVSPNVLSVGGTSLTIVSSTSGVYSVGSETSWSGSGGGYSQFEKEPTWQYAVQSSGRRSTPDVSYDANPSTGFAVYDTYGYRGWYVIGGTSAGAPQWAGLVAIVNQVRAGNGLTSMTNTASSLYALDTQQSYSTDFRDITSGTAGRYRAGTGYDLVTGLGSPQVQNIVAALGGASAAVKAGSAASPSGKVVSLRDLLGRRTTTIAERVFVVNLPAPSLAPMNLASATPADLPAGTIYLPDAYVNAGSGMSTDMPLWSKNAGAVSHASSLKSPADANGLDAIGTFGDASEISLNETPAGRQASGTIMPEANSLGLVASPVPQADLAASISTPDRRYEAVDAFMAQNPFADAKAEKAGIPVLPDAEKTDFTLRAEALAAVILMFARSRLKYAKNERASADDNRWRVQYS